MRNIITSSPAKLIPQALQVLPGIVTHGGALGFPATFEATLTQGKADLMATDSAYEQGRITRKLAVAARKVALKNARIHVRAVRELMRPKISPTYSQNWDALGFVGSLRIPETVDRMVTTLNKMGNHLAANPALGAADSNLLAPKTTAIETALVNTTAALNVLQADVQRLKEARTEAAKVVNMLVREVLSTLRLKLQPLDSRWVEFGFNKPGAQPTPDVPTKLTTAMVNANTLQAKWPAVPRADHYRVWKRVVGTDAELIAVGNTSELNFVMEQVPTNASVEVALSAVNESGESLRSVVIVVQT